MRRKGESLSSEQLEMLAWSKDLRKHTIIVAGHHYEASLFLQNVLGFPRQGHAYIVSPHGIMSDLTNVIEPYLYLVNGCQHLDDKTKQKIAATKPVRIEWDVRFEDPPKTIITIPMECSYRFGPIRHCPPSQPRAYTA